MFEFSILGPLEIRYGSARVAVGGGRQRSLLALLLVAASEVVPSERLADMLWDGRPPDQADQALRVYVSRLRRVLRHPGNEELLVTRPPGYLLRLGPEALDAARFETLLARGRAQAAAGDPRGAGATLRQALSLWRGPALVDVPDSGPIRAERARLEELRLAAWEDRVDADLACGCHHELVPELGALVETYPLRERLWGQRMLALYRAGRQADALVAYQNLRRNLAHDLGIEPGPSLRRLERAILRHEPELDWSRAGPSPPSCQPPRPASAIPLPGFLTGGGPIFVGRTRELDGLENTRRAVAGGQRRLVLISGEPGVGKTRLVAELAGSALAAGMTVLGGRCDEELDVPYQPFVEALRHFLRHTPRERLAAHLGDDAAELTRLVPDVSEWVDGLRVPVAGDLETERYRLFEAVAAWLVTVAGDRPTLFVVDDLHWAPKPTLLLLRHLVRSLQAVPVLVVATYRDSELSPAAPLTGLLADLRREEGVDRLTLAGLGEDAVASFAHAVIGELPPDAIQALARAVHAETDGNPFFVGEVLRLLRDTRRLDAVGVPEGVREVVKRRLSRLSDDANLAIRLAAVAGVEFDVSVLRATGLLEENTLLDALEEAAAARLLVELAGPGSGYRFVHALARAAIYDDLSGPRRRRFHRQLGEALERLGSDHPSRWAELAHHFIAAAEGSDERAIRYTLQAAEAASGALAHEQAATLYERAAGLLGDRGDDARRLEVLLLAGDAHRRAGDFDRARELFVTAFVIAGALDDAEALGRAALRAGEASPVWAVDEELVGLLRSALTRLGEGGGPLVARLLARLAQALYYSTDDKERSELSLHAVAMARRSGDPGALAAVLCARHAALWGPDDVEQRLEVANEILDLAGTTESPELELQAHAWRLVDHLELGDIAATDEAIAAHATLARRLHQPVHQRDQAVWRNMRAMLDGRFFDAEHGVRELFELSEPAGDPAATMAWCQRWWLVSERGRPNEMAALAPQLADVANRQQAAQAAWWAGISLHYARLGDHDAAQELFDDLAGGPLAEVARDAVWLNAITHLAETAAVLGDERAAAIYDLLVPYSSRMAVMDRAVVCKAAVSYYLGMLATTLGRWAEATGHFEAALERHRWFGSRPLVARTECGYARMLATRGDGGGQRAATLAGHALAEAQALGMAGVEAQALALQ